MGHSLAEFAHEQGIQSRRVCGVCSLFDDALIAVVDDNERKDRKDPSKVSRRVVAAYLQHVTGRSVTGDMVSAHAARHLQEPTA